MKTEELKEIAKKVRLQILDMSLQAKQAHLGSALSCVEILVTLYFGGIMKFDKNCVDSEERDRFLLSKGHGTMAHFAVLNQAGCLSNTELDRYHENGYFLHVHPQMNKEHGIEVSGGSLGQGLPFAAGIACALKRKRNAAKVYCVVGDGELNEGSNWEVMLFAAHQGLDNLCVIVDRNKLQSDGPTKEIIDMSPLADKLKSFGFETKECDGHDFESLLSAFSFSTDIPRCVIADTMKGKGVSFAENEVSWHYNTLTQRLYEEARAEVENED